jgi:CBS domain-containing protein
MRARDVIGAVPAVTSAHTVLDAVAALVAAGTPGVAVVDDDRPHAVLPGSLLVGLTVPTYVKDDPSLARVLGEVDPEELRRRVGAMTVADVLADAEPDPYPIVAADASLLEIATTMADIGVGIVLVVDADGRYLGAVTATDLLATLQP